MTLEAYLAVFFARASDTLGLPWQWVALAGLLLIACAGQWLVGLLVRRLQRAATRSAQVWDDALVTALQAPAKLAWWLLLTSLLFVFLPALATYQPAATRVVNILLVLLLPWFLLRLIANVETQLLESREVAGASTDRAAVRATARLLRIAICLVTALTLLQTLGISVSGLLAFGGIGGIAVGFAAKDLLANFFGGLSVYLDRPFTIGDWIRSPDRSIEGTVEDIGWRITRIRTFDKRPLYVPNAVFSQIAIENPSRMQNRRIYEKFGLRYGDSRVVGPVIADIRAMLTEHAAIDQGQTIIANFEAFGASSLDCFVYCLTTTTNWVEYHAVKQEVLLQILDIVHKHGADIAFPTRTVELPTRELPAP